MSDSPADNGISKYAALTTNWRSGDQQKSVIGGDIRCNWWNVHDVGEDGARDAWREAFGTFQWDALRGKRPTMFVFGHDTADITNAINKQLEDRVQLARYAYLLNRPPILSGGAMWVISGMADNDLRPLSLRSWHRHAELSNPYFIQRAPFARSLDEFLTNSWMESWCDDFVAMDSARGGKWLLCPPFEMGVLSFWDASINTALDFRMPALVRTIESIVAPPRRSATLSFVQRSALFAQDVQRHPYFSATGHTLDEMLRELYQLRSDAVHGKWPLRDMQQAGREDDVALLDFAAEMIARAAIKWALRNRTKFATYQTRAALEDAWANGTIPPP